MFGHTGAYGVGQIAGTVTAIGASFLIGNAAGGTMGLIRCGSGLQKAAKIYSAVDTAAEFASAGQNLFNGTAGVGDVLNLAPALGFAGGKLAGLPQNCFEAGTVVLTGGSPGEEGVFEAVNIEEIQVGDLVWTKDDTDPNAEMVLRPVTEVYVSRAYDLQELSIQGADGNVEVIHVTDEHPFYVQGKGWTGAAASITSATSRTSGMSDRNGSRWASCATAWRSRRGRGSGTASILASKCGCGATRQIVFHRLPKH